MDIDAFMTPGPGSVILFLLTILFLIFIFKGVQRVPDGHSRIVERLGRRHRVLSPGISVIVPLIDTIKTTGLNLETIMDNGQSRKTLFDGLGNISMAEHRLDPPVHKLLAKDSSEVFVDPIVYFRISEPMKAVYDVSDLGNTMLNLSESILRQEVAKQDGDSVISSRDIIGENLRAALQEAATNWGIRILRVEIEDIYFDKDITDSLSKARKQELDRRAEVVEAQKEADKEVIAAEAFKKAEILRAEALVKKAEGEKQAAILKAEAEYETQKLEAEASFLLQSREQEGIAQGYAAITQSLSQNPEAIVALEALKAQTKVAESLGHSNNALIIPNETAGLFGAFTAAIKGVDAALNINNKKT